MDRQKKKKEILETSLKVFGRYGFKKTTVEDLAAEAGMTKGNLYLYAENKRDLYIQAVAFGLKRWQQSVALAIDGIDDVVHRFLTICRTSYGYLARDEDMRNVVIQDPAVFPLYPQEDPFYQINLESMEMVRAILVEGIEKGIFRSVDTDHLTAYIYSVYIMFIHKRYVKPEGKTTEGMFEAALDTLLHGLLKR